MDIPNPTRIHFNVLVTTWPFLWYRPKFQLQETSKSYGRIVTKFLRNCMKFPLAPPLSHRPPVLHPFIHNKHQHWNLLSISAEDKKYEFCNTVAFFLAPPLHHNVHVHLQYCIMHLAGCGVRSWSPEEESFWISCFRHLFNSAILSENSEVLRTAKSCACMLLQQYSKSHHHTTKEPKTTSFVTNNCFGGFFL